MANDHWERIKAVAGEAWERPAAERGTYISRACAPDEAFAREVSSFVSAMDAAQDWFEDPPRVPVDDIALAIDLTGRRIGAYEILSRLGAGGMGEVYSARDTRLDRIVALKVLVAITGFAMGPPRQRMEREARAVASLNHPHICTLYDIGSQDGIDFLVMEHLDGETLASRLSRGMLPISDALQYAEQIASALLAAHQAGIVHRDVKPANIMFARAGPGTPGMRHAKLLDFGLAKANRSEAPSGAAAVGADRALELTQSGEVLGTAAYMAPEQIDRNTADVRTDIFAFGAVLFEMLTGRKAFSGTARTEVLDAIRHGEVPRVSSLRQGVGPALDRLVMTCLAKSAADRFQSMRDLLPGLRALQRPRSTSSKVQMLAGTAVALLVALGATTTWRIARRPAVQSPVAPSVVRLAASAGVVGAPALSPDGSAVAFTWVGDTFDNPELVLLPVGSTTRVRLTNDPGVEDWPTWSPDGTRLAFIRCRPERCGIFTLAVGGGPQHELRTLNPDRYYGLAWSPDGRSIAFAERPAANEPYALFLLTLDGLVVRRLTSPSSGSGDLRFAFAPDGRTLAVVRFAESIGVHLLALEGGTDTVLLTGQREWFGSIAWPAGGRQLILSANQQGVRRLWRLPIGGGGLEQLAVAGEDAYYPSTSARGERLAFIRDFRDWDFSRVTIDRAQVGPSAPFASSPRPDLEPAFSPDGGRLAFISDRNGTRELWVSNADGSQPRQLTSGREATAGRPSWSPDGRLVAFQANGIQVTSASGGPSRTIVDDGQVPTWSADGRWIYFTRYRNGTLSVWKIPAGGGPATQAIASDACISHESADGTSLYFARLDGGIWRRPVAGGAETRVVQDFDPSLVGYWSVVNDGIYYVARVRLPNRVIENRLRFFDVAAGRTSDMGLLTGKLDDWAGGLTVSPDRRTVIYSYRSYESSEVVVLEGFR